MFDFSGLLWAGLFIGFLMGGVVFCALPLLWAWMGWTWVEGACLAGGLVLGVLITKAFKE